MKSNIYILDGVRTAVGSTFKSLKDFSAAQLGSLAIKEMLSRNKIGTDLISEVILGNTVSAGAGQNPARQAAFFSGLLASVPGVTVNSVCGSGLQSVIFSAQNISCQEKDFIIAGGAESASQCPSFVKKTEDGSAQQNNAVDSLIHDGLLCMLTGKHMGELAEFLAEKLSISREAQDEYALSSHLKATTAQDAGKFIAEIIPVTIKEGQFLSKDERPRKNITLDRLKSLPAAFKENGTVTAGNSSIPSDGAAVVLLASEAAVKKYTLKPKARILSYTSIAVEPQLVFTAAVTAVKECLKKGGLSIKDVDLFEISEAFAVQAIATQKELKIPENKMNVYGGDVALGHPLGAAGTRILVTLLHALQEEKKKIGVAAVCLGGGGAVAIAIENLL